MTSRAADRGPRRGRRARWPAIGAALAAAALVAACASGDDDGAATPTTTTSTIDAAASTTAPDDTGPTSDDGSATSTVDAGDVAPDTPVPSGGECPTDALATADEPIEIELWHSMAATTGVVLEELIADYNAGQDTVRVTPVFQGGYAESFSKYVNTVRAGGTLPDIIQLSEISLQQMYDSGTIVPIGECVASSGLDLSDVPERLLDQYRIGGQLVTMPFQLANPVLFYDGNLFAAAGLDPDDPPSTLDELEETGRTLVDAGVVESAIALEIDAWSFEQWIATAGATLVNHDNGRTARADQALLDSPEVTELLATLARLHDSGLLLSTGRGGEQSGLARFVAVAQGTAAMTIGSSASLGEIYEQLYRVPDIDARVGPFPKLGDGATTIGGGSLYLTNQTSDAERAAVWSLISWLDEPAQQVRWSIGTGYVPIRTSAVDDPALQQVWAERPGFRVAYDQLVDAGALPTVGGPVIGDYLGVREAIESGLEALYAGDSVEAVQAEMQDAADAAIQDYNRRVGG